MASQKYQFSLTKLLISPDLLCSMVANQIAFDQRDSNLIDKFQRAMDRCCEALDSIEFDFPRHLI